MEEAKPEGGAPPAPKKGRAGLWIGVAIVVIVVAILLAAVFSGLLAPSAAKPSLRVGTLLSLTGALSQYGPGNTKGAQLAVEEINDAGGVLGQKVELVIADDQTNPTAAAAATTKLITANKVNAIVGAQFSGGTIASISIAKDNGVPMVSPSATSPALSNLTLTGGWFFRTAPPDSLQGVVAGDYLYKNLSLRYISIMGRDDSYGRGLAGVVKARFTALGGHVNDTVIIAPGQTDYTSDITTLFSHDPKGVYFVAFPGEALTVMKQWQAGLVSYPGWNRQWVFSEGLDSQKFMDQLRDPAVGVDVTKILGTAPVSPFGAVYDSFAALYKARFSGQDPVLYTETTYDAVYLIALAAQKAGAVDGASIKPQLAAVSKAPGTVIKPGQWAQALTALKGGGDVNWEGAAGSEDFDQYGDVRGSYEIWGVNSTFKIHRIAFIPESTIQTVSPLSPTTQQVVSTPNSFLVLVQTAATWRRV